MRINDLRTRIVFEQSETVSDEYDNRVTRWSPYYACWATMLMSTGSELDGDASTTPGESVSFTVRSCSETRAIKPQGFRAVLDGQIYDIKYIDRMADKGQSLKIHAALQNRRAEE